MKERIIELDFVKGILISLMVLFHLTLFTTAYGWLTNWVYAFHMSGFLLISGYLQKNSHDFLQVKKAVRKIFLPYLVFEMVYLTGLAFMGATLGSQNHVELSWAIVTNRLFIEPIGTYWYLHTLFICVIVCFICDKFCKNTFVALLLAGCVLFILTMCINGLKWGNVIYFLIGNFIQRLNLKITYCVIPTMCAVIPISLISLYAIDLSREEISGIGLTYLMLSFLMALCFHVFSWVRNLSIYLGKNSLCIVLFSPIFTVLTKFYAPVLNFDSTHVLWAIISMFLVICMCLLGALICDKLKLSQLIMGNVMYQKYGK